MNFGQSGAPPPVIRLPRRRPSVSRLARFVSRFGRLVAVSLALLVAVPSLAQSPNDDAKLERLVAPVALYPDPLLAQVLAAATFAEQLPDAARWAQVHRGLAGEPLAAAIGAVVLPWDPTVQTLLPFPSLLARMAADAKWSSALGEAFLAQQQDVLRAVQRLRHRAQASGSLQTDDHVVVACEPCSILPRNPAYIFVPSYDPKVVFAPRAAAREHGTIAFGAAVNVGGFEPFGYAPMKFEVLGGYFQAWGWGRGGIDWTVPRVVINHAAWGRTSANRAEYMHPYADLRPSSPAKQRGSYSSD